MKKILLSVFYSLVCIFSSSAQTLFGTTNTGGDFTAGTINKLILPTNNFSIAKSFDNIEIGPGSEFTQATNGKFYSTVAYGGFPGLAIIFSFDPLSGTYTHLKDFEVDKGATTTGGLLQANDGKLYGMTSNGNNNSLGTIFTFDPVSSTYTKLKEFDLADGSNPVGSLVQGGDGKLYGMTLWGGTNDFGVIFSFDPLTSAFTKIIDFDGTNGSSPSGSLVLANDGKLYGVTGSGGNSGHGVIFSFNPATSVYTRLKDFNDADGTNPVGTLTLGTDGTLYGSTPSGGSAGAGVIFSFNPSTSTYTKLKDFETTDDFHVNVNGYQPVGKLLLANDGKLYGMTNSGGALGHGVIFSFDPTSSSFTKMKDFNDTTGGGPTRSLIQASNGKLYSMAGGGSCADGVIFSFDPVASVYTKLKDFGTNETGRNVSAGLLKASDGKLYGMTNDGGSTGNGVIFSYDPSSSGFTKLKDFDKINGGQPSGRLMQASNGKLYGMTAHGGNSGHGVIFSFDPASSIYVKLKDFELTDGAYPFGSLMQASNGKLYGMTTNGGKDAYEVPPVDFEPGGGVLFSFDISTSTYTKLKDFASASSGDINDGAYPTDIGLIQASDGKLYGMTAGGGSLGGGIIFSFDPSASTYTKVKEFGGANGSGPSGSLVHATNGKLYGTTTQGGINDHGVLFSFEPGTTTYTKLYDFEVADGSYPFGGLMQASDGKLYGMTSLGGVGYQYIYSFDPVASVFTKLKNFDSSLSNFSPSVGSTLVEVAEGGPLPVTLLIFSGKNAGGNNQLSWKVENELNINYYELQRSTDGQNFVSISQIRASGNGTYTYNDLLGNLSSFLFYYRLKSVDKDDKIKYSEVLKIRTDGRQFAIVSPNPFKNKLILTVESPVQDKTALIITDMIGKRLYKENIMLFPGTNVYDINEAGRLPKGTYLLTIITSRQTQTIKVVKGN